MLSRFFIYRPIFAAVLSIVMMLIGSIALVALPIARYPEIAPPTVKVTTSYPGANAETVADTVATPIEQEVNGVEGMVYMTSISSSDGSMELTVTFEVGTDLDMANVLVQNRVSTAEAKLPEEVKRQGLTVKKQSTEITLVVSLFSPDDSLGEVFLNNYATLRIRDELTRVPGVGEVSIFGAGEYGMRIWLDPDKLKSRSLSTVDVVNAVREQNVQVAAGQIGQPPAPAGQPFQYTVNTLGRLVDVEQFENIIVRTGAEGQITRVRDIARVELSATTFDLSSRLSGRGSASLMLYQLPGANAIAIAEGIKAKMVELSARFPEGLDYIVAYDSTDVINASIKEVIQTLFITLVLVVLTVYVFLQNFRATLIPTLTIPVSLIGTFAVMAALGYTINQLTLFGLVLVIGIVVDDAIVVVENVTRHIDEGGMSPRDAAVAAMEEVTGPVIATTLVLLAVFVPTVFLGGITGQLFRQFAVTISVATVLSSINALTLSPALCAVLLRKTPQRHFFLFRWINKTLDATTSVYLHFVRVALRLAVLGFIGFIGLIAVAGYGFTILPTGFVPQEDEGWCVVNAQLPDAASLERTIAVAERLSAICLDTPGVENVITINGYSLIDASRTSSSTSALVTFTPWDERTEPHLSQAAILASINARFAQIQEGVAIAFAPPSLPGIGVAGGFAMQLQDRGGVGLNMLQQVTTEFINDGNAQAGLAGMYSGFRANVPQIFVNIDRDQVKSMGLNLGDVFNTLQSYLGSTYVNDFNLFGRIFQVKVQAESEYRAKPDDIARLEVRNAAGDMVPLGAFAEIQEILGPQTVAHHNVYPSAKITGRSGPGFSSGQAMQILTNMASQKLPSTMGFEWTDLSYQENAASGQAAVIFLFSILLVYLTLAAQYESWSIPIAVVLAVPTALLGAVLALFARGLDNNVYTQIGIVLLIGLSAKTSILIVEFAKVKREEGMSIPDAALAASRLRFRAVLMTAFSFILGVIPLVIASGAGAASRQSLGTTVFGGMVVATVVSVVTVPMLFSLIQGVSERLGGRGVTSEPASEPPEAEEPLSE